ncbi:GNAT family N-acetyltransferase [Mucilaginibacter sp.]|jgi:putative acetyltransferase|uniref:GNAT family N-acetyltransferase n=1 Tax=Mucilaginibacter sp. TaxID=1882438 RepID=UPI002C9A0EF3|nr:GNAT family N-acetyltransferase [Mucilaginibacter sp.]HTI60413.1 GNAT family N-acetyltransferase [Mucilaginibacter sp.]
MKISIAAETDYEELVTIWEASVRATHSFLPEEEILYFKPFVKQYFDSVDLYLVRPDNRISGFLGMSGHEVQMLFLRPDARGKGIGRSLMEFAINDRGATRVEVNEQNEQAVGFYQHLGFKVCDRSEVDYLGKPYPILSMELI